MYIQNSSPSRVRRAVTTVILIAGICLLVCADQLTKLWAMHFLKNAGEKPILGNFLVFTYVENTGAAFSLLQNQRVFLVAVPAVFATVCFILLVTRRFPSLIMNISLALITAGGVGNLIDRVMRGYVVDFIYAKKINFAIFNFADSCVSVGVVVMLLAVLFNQNLLKGSGQRSDIFAKRRRH